MTTAYARNILELVYLHCWGPLGSPDLRDRFCDFIKPIFQRDFHIGDFTYLGEGKFRWIDEADAPPAARATLEALRERR